jgi:hypothetical protein
MPLDERFGMALQSRDPVQQLRSLALGLSSQGYDKAAIIDKFEEVRQQLRQEEREADEDAVMDAMDCLAGWCSPHMTIPLDTQGTSDLSSSPLGANSMQASEPYDFSTLYEQYPSLIAQMDNRFNSHQFILELARQHQKEYIEALYHFRDTDAPFMNLHGVLSRHFNALPHLVKRVGDSSPAESQDIFGRKQGCALWEKVR